MMWTAMPRRPGESPREYIDRVITSTGEARRQMEQRQGPLYELSKANSRIISEAWRAAGSPRKPPGSGLQKSASGHLERTETPEWRAWRAWIRERERLRRENRMRGTGGMHYGHPADRHEGP